MKRRFSSMCFGRPCFIPIRRHRFGKMGRRLSVIFIFGAIVYSVVASLTHIYPIIEDVAKKQLNVYTSDIINSVVTESLGDGDIYDKLVDITYGADGKITAITTDTAAANKLKTNLSAHIIDRLGTFGSDGFSIPLGNLTDIIFLSGIGPDIPFKIIPYGEVKVDFRSAFTGAGINQTRHEIYIDISADMRAISAVARIHSTVSTSVVAAQTVIVGDVPDYFGRTQ